MLQMYALNTDRCRHVCTAHPLTLPKPREEERVVEKKNKLKSPNARATSVLPNKFQGASKADA